MTPASKSLTIASLFPERPARWIGRLFLIYAAIGAIAAIATMAVDYFRK